MNDSNSTLNLTATLGVIEVSGVDAAIFLQGQLTNNITQLQPQQYQMSAHLNNKGRMLASFIVYRAAADTYYLITAREILDSIIPRLKMFVLRSKVSITQFNATMLFSIHDIAITNLATISLQDGYYLSIVNTASTKIDSESATTNDIHSWKIFLINHGLPLIYTTTQELFIPQHVNYDLLGGVNFKKGCYTGQEIVARTHYLGKVKRRMYRFTSKYALQVGQEIISPTFTNQTVGNIVDASAQTDGIYYGLASLQTDCINTAFLDTANQQILQIKEINY